MLDFSAFVDSILNEVPALPPPLQIVDLGNSSANNGGGSSSVTFPRPTGYHDACFMVAILASETGVTITAPTGWTQHTGTSNGMRLSWYWRAADGGADDPIGGYQWTFSAPVRALGGIVAFDNVDKASPVFNHNTVTSTATSQSNPGVAATPAYTYILFGATVDSNEGIDPTGATLLMTQEFEPRSTRNMAVWSEPLPEGGATGARTYTIGTAVNQPLVSTVLALNPVQ